MALGVCRSGRYNARVAGYKAVVSSSLTMGAGPLEVAATNPGPWAIEVPVFRPQKGVLMTVVTVVVAKVQVQRGCREWVLRPQEASAFGLSGTPRTLLGHLFPGVQDIPLRPIPSILVATATSSTCLHEAHIHCKNTVLLPQKPSV